MHVDYFETSALIGVGRPGQNVTLNDLHKAAWGLYTGSGVHAIPKGTPRPFVFSADPVPMRDNTFMFVVRSTTSFPRSNPVSVMVNEGDTWRLGFHFQAVVTVEVWNEQQQAFKAKRRILKTDMEQRIIAPALSRNGLEVLNTALVGPTYRSRFSDRQRKPLVPAWHANVEVVVSDTLLAATAITSGVTRGRAYGFGMLTFMDKMGG